MQIDHACHTIEQHLLKTPLVRFTELDNAITVILPLIQAAAFIERQQLTAVDTIVKGQLEP